MNSHHDFLFGVMALKARLVDPDKLVEAGAALEKGHATPLADLMVERGWIRHEQRTQLDALVESALAQHDGVGTVTDHKTAGSLAHLPWREEPMKVPKTQKTQKTRPPHEQFSRKHVHAAGGIGQVWLAHDEELDRDVALKELLPEWSGNGLYWDRFLQEAQITGRLEHPGIVPVYALVRDPNDGHPFYAMRFIQGRTLHEAIQAFHRKRLDGADVGRELLDLLDAFVAVCNTVAYAHSRGVIHRDLKGQNVVLGQFGEVIVLDWGLAKVVNQADRYLELGGPPPAQGSSPDMTMQGQVMGTPAYMAPEQAAGQIDKIDERSDVYGLGAMLYEILSGHPPYEGVDSDAVTWKVRNEKVQPPRRHWADAPADLEDVCLRAMARDPANRFPSAKLLGHEVHIWQDVQRQRAVNELKEAHRRLMAQQAALVELTNCDAVCGDDLTAGLRSLIETSARVLGVERVSIWKFTPDRSTIRCLSMYQRSENQHTTGMELSAADFPHYFKSLAESEVIAADEAQNDERTKEFTAGYLVPLGIGAMMDVPIHPDAMICHEHVGPARHWLPDEQLFAIAVAHLAAHLFSKWSCSLAEDELLATRARRGRN